MTKVAKLVTVTMTVRVIVDQDNDDREILESSMSKIVDSVKMGDYLNDYEIKDDKECPFGSLKKDNKLTLLEYCQECYNMGRPAEVFYSVDEIRDTVGDGLVDDWEEEWEELMNEN